MKAVLVGEEMREIRTLEELVDLICDAAETTASAPGSVELARRAGRFCAIWSI